MSGGTGDDYYIVDNIGDRVFETAGGGYDIVFAKDISYTLAAGQEVESLGVLNESSTNVVDLAGNEFANRIIGNDASNGFTGGGGADLFYGNGGNDFYVVDSADDRVIETAGDGYDIVFVTGPGFTLSQGSEVESIGAYDQAATTAMSLFGNELDNRMAGNNGSNSFDGGAGADLMYGSLGNDYYVVDNAGDRPIEKVGEGYDIVFAKSSYTLEAGQELESLGAFRPTGTASLDLTGNEFANLIVGNAGANTINGGGGADVLYGEGGADIFAFTTAPGGGNADRMADFVSGTDKIALDDAVFSALAPGALNPGAFVIGSAPLDGDDRIIYNSSSGFLLYDADGSGAGGAVLFATVAPGTIISASDFLVI